MCQPHSCSTEFNAKFNSCIFIQKCRQKLFLQSSLLFQTFAQGMGNHRLPSCCGLCISDLWGERGALLWSRQWEDAIHPTVTLNPGLTGPERGEKSKEGSDSRLQTESIPQSQKERQLKAHYQWALRAGSRVTLRQAKPGGQAVPAVAGIRAARFCMLCFMLEVPAFQERLKPSLFIWQFWEQNSTLIEKFYKFWWY